MRYQRKGLSLIEVVVVMRKGLSLIEVVVVMAIIGVLIGLTVPAVQMVRGAAARSTCTNRLRQIGLALHGYNDARGSLPPGMSYNGGRDETPFQAWHAKTLPFIERDDLWRITVQAFANNRDFHYDPPHIARYELVPTFVCPVDGRAQDVSTEFGAYLVAFTSFQGVNGTDLIRRDGLLFLDSHIRLADIRDGTAYTLMVGERPPSADERFGWWYAGKGQQNTGSADSVLGVRELRTSLKPLDRDCPRGPYRFMAGRNSDQCDAFHFWSHHPGGAHFLMADGAVHFFGYSADDLLPALATRDGGEAAALP